MLSGCMAWVRLVESYHSNRWNVGIRRICRLITDDDADSGRRGHFHILPELVVWCVDNNAHTKPAVPSSAPATGSRAVACGDFVRRQHRSMRNQKGLQSICRGGFWSICSKHTAKRIVRYWNVFALNDESVGLVPLRVS